VSFSNQNSVCFPIVPLHDTCPTHLILFALITLTVLQLWGYHYLNYKFFVCSLHEMGSYVCSFWLYCIWCQHCMLIIVVHIFLI
jgi:hypothetical protein